MNLGTKFAKARDIAAAIAAAAITGGAALPADAAQPRPWEIWHQPPGSDMMARIEWFDFYTLWFIVPITALVMGLLLIVIFRFNHKKPIRFLRARRTIPWSRLVWTIGPIIVLIMIAFPSFDLLKRQLAPTDEPAMTVKATGYQWYWGYEYQDDSAISFDSIMLQENERDGAGKGDKATYPRLLAVDNELVVPVDTQVRVLVTGADVIHSFAMPAFGIKIDAVPGRLNETWFKAEREGLYYGQCSELCGTQSRLHADRNSRRQRRAVHRLEGARRRRSWRRQQGADVGDRYGTPPQGRGKLSA